MLAGSVKNIWNKQNVSSNVSNQSGDLNHLPTDRSTNFSNVNQHAFNRNFLSGSSNENNTNNNASPYSNKDTNGAMDRS